MKNFSIYILSAFILMSCGGSNDVSNGQGSNDGTIESIDKYADGKDVYFKTCVACHQAEGEGLIGTFPPLADSDYMLENIDRAISQVINGSNEEMTVNGEIYNGIMPAQILTDQEVTDVMNYVLNSWGNDGGEVSLKQVKKAKHP